MNRGWLPGSVRTGLKRGLGYFLAARDLAAGQPQVSLLLLAHMRSGSSLLHHLLVSHPDVIGCGERNAAYASVRDLERLRVDAYARQGGLLRVHRYVTDQINHDRFGVSEEVLTDARVRVIFLIRAPGASIASMVHVLGRLYPGVTVDGSAAYYTERLATLSRSAARSGIPPGSSS